MTIVFMYLLIYLLKYLTQGRRQKIFQGGGGRKKYQKLAKNTEK